MIQKRHCQVLSFPVFFISLLMLVFVFLGNAYGGITEIVSVDSNGVQGNDLSTSPSISADGRFVTFFSSASNLVPGDTNGAQDVFVHDRLTGTTERVSISSNGIQGNNSSHALSPSISADGRFVTFFSLASTLVPGDTNGAQDVFVHDRLTGTTERVSVDSNGIQGNNGSHSPSISTDGRFIVFASYASTLVPGDTNGVQDVFVHDRLTRTTERVSVDSNGIQGNNHSYGYPPIISADGRFVVFISSASNLVPGDTNGVDDVFVHDRQTRITERVSVDSNGIQGNNSSNNSGRGSPISMSADGRFIAFSSSASNLVPGDTNGVDDVFVHDRQTRITERVSVDSNGIQGNNHNYSPSISADGRFVVFTSSASTLVPGDTNGAQDVFVHDRLTRTTERVSVDSNGIQGNNHSDYASINGDGKFVAFGSVANNLVPNDINGKWNVFVHAIGEGNALISLSPTAIPFGNTTTTSPQTITITNNSLADLRIGTLSLKGANASEFIIQNDTCSGKTLAPSGSCTVQVKFSPLSSGSKIATLYDPTITGISISLTGTGISSYTLTITKAGTGTGTVMQNTGAIIWTGNTGTGTYNSTASLTLTAAADTGSTFTGWSGACTGTSTCTVTMDSAKSVTATFTLNTYDIIASAGAGGNGMVSCNSPITYGGTCTCTINPNTGYHISDVLVDGVSVGPVSAYTFTNVAAGHTISAVFGVNTYAPTITAGSGGSISASPAIASYGGNQTFTIAPDAGYHITDVLVDGVSVGAVSTYTLTNVTGSHAISASFAINTYDIAASGGGGNGAVSCSSPVSYGGSCTCAITPNTGYHIAAVLVDGVSMGAVSSYTFANVTANHTISASFAINTYTASASAGAGGSISPSSSTVNYGGSQTYTITPSQGYHLQSLTDNGVDVTALVTGGTYTIANVTTAHSLTATFEINTYPLNVSKAGTGFGTVTSAPAGISCGANCSATYNHGTIVTLTAKADTGSTFTGWTGACSASGGGTGTCTVTMDAAKNVTATFADTTPPQVTISATPNILWPPNHKIRDVVINGSAVDKESGIASVVITVTDEYGIYNMTVPGFGSTVKLEASRKGKDKDGRKYTITAIATDKAGNKSTAVTEVIVPHDMSDKDGEKEDDDHHEEKSDKKGKDHEKHKPDRRK